MKNILIIAGGIIAKDFLERLFSSKTSILHNYTIITQDKNTLPEIKVNYENYEFLNFDPTSFDRLKLALKKDFEKFMVILDDKFETESVCRNLHQIDPNIEICVVDSWGIKGGAKLKIIDSKKMICTRFMDFLPDVPVVANNIGIGAGEIMEVRIPAGSSYAYKHIGYFKKNRWRIALIYRNQDIVIPQDNMLIMPNDVLLIVGEPRILENVYKSINKKIGQFPNPFGNNIYLPIDMKNMSQGRVSKLVQDAILFHTKLNNKKLHIHVINPTISKPFTAIKRLFRTKSINVIIDYKNENFMNFQIKNSEFDIGLIITDGEFFELKKRDLHSLNLPVLKIGKGGFMTMSDGVIVGKGDDIESQTNTIMDCCLQLGLEIKFYHFDPNSRIINKNLDDHFDGISKLFNKKIEVIESASNPILKLTRRRNLLQFLPFSNDILNSDIFSPFKQNTDMLYYKLADNFQLFIPQSDKN